MTPWRRAAEACGLGQIRSKTIGTRTLSASADKVRVKFAGLDDSDASTEIRVTVEGAPQEGPRLFPESVTTVIMKRTGTVEIELGDASFDDEFFVAGEPAELYARLDAATRRDLFAVNRQSNLYIARGELRVSCDEARLASTLSTFLATLIRIAQRLFGPLDLAAALTQNARSDSAAMRLHNLLVLALEYASDERTKPALRAAIGDAVPEIRLRAAQALGEEGHETLRRLAADTEIPDGCSAEAVKILGVRLDTADVERVLATALRRRRVATAAECAGVLGEKLEPAAEARLSDLVRREREPIGVAAARALGRRPRPASEGALLEALSSDSDEVRFAVIEALGKIGSAAAVMPLRQVTGPRELQRAVRQAVAKIQSRAAGASPGQLSLADAASGQVSLAPAEAGGLSFPPPAAGALSISTAKPADPTRGADEPGGPA